MTRVSGGVLAAIGAAGLAIAAIANVLVHTHHAAKPKTSVVTTSTAPHPPSRPSPGRTSRLSAAPPATTGAPRSNGQPASQPSLAELARRGAAQR